MTLADKIAAIRAGLAGVTPGPWRHYSGLLRPQFPTEINEVQALNLPSIVSWPGFDDSARSAKIHKANRKDEPLLNGLMAKAMWPTTQARLQGGGCYLDPAKAAARINSGHQANVQDYMVATWPTVQANDGTKGNQPPVPHATGVSLPQRMVQNRLQLAIWSTPRASDGAKGGPNMAFGAGGTPLPTQMHKAYWVTANARDGKDTPGMATVRKDGKSKIDQLPRQLSATALSGQTPNGYSATTEKRGAPNPAFAFWLMGFPDEWINGTSLAMQSYRPSSRNRSSP